MAQPQSMPARPDHLQMNHFSIPPPNYHVLSPLQTQTPPAMMRSLTVEPPPLSHRHSFHGEVSNAESQDYYSRLRDGYLNESTGQIDSNAKRRNVLVAQRSFNNPHDPPKCQRKRFSATNFNFNLGSLPEQSESVPSIPTAMMSRDDPTMQQRATPPRDSEPGADIHDSPRAGSVVSLSSTTSEGRKEQNQHHQHPSHTAPSHHVVTPQGMPIEGRVLVDPATGQHYIVPSQGGNLYYPPMYYQQQPHYGFAYPPPMAPHAYMQGGQPGYMAIPPYAAPGQRYASTPPQYRHPPFGNATSLPSNEDLTKERRYDDPPPPSPSHSSLGGHPHPPYPYHYAQQPPHRASPPQPEDPEARDHFRRDVITRSSAEYPRPGELNRQGSGEFSRSTDAFNRMNTTNGSSTSLDRQMYSNAPQPQPQQQNWWSRGAQQGPQAPLARPEQDTMTDVESSMSRRQGVAQSSPPPGCASDNEAARRAQEVQQEAPPPPRPAPKPVRMEFDFSKPLPEEEQFKPKPKVANPACTAFTVTFDKEGGTDSISLQDAARKSGTGRRLLGRRSGPGGGQSATATSSSSGGSTAKDKIVRKKEAEQKSHLPQDSSSKSYLLNKLLQGPLSSGVGSADVANEDAVSQVSSKKDNDAVSEAGTFVIGAGQSKMKAARVVGDSSDSESDSDDSSTASSRGVSPLRTPTSQAQTPRQSLPGPETPVSDSSSVLLKELIALKRAQHPRPSPAAAAAHSVAAAQRRSCAAAAQPSTSTSAAPLPPRARQSLGATPANRSVMAQKTQAPNSNFRRGDGGRFSMRTGAGPLPPTHSPQPVKKPPFRAGTTSARPTTTAQRESEMNAWLRRKDYNPMKAVQEAKKQQAVKQSMTDISEDGCCSSTDSERGESFMSNRSMSFHVGPNKTNQRRSGEGSEITRNKSEESVAYEGASTASQRVIAEYSREVVKDINRLTERSKKGGKQELSGLARAVDLLSNKCKKSIELIRNQNKGCLSVSVEDLLSTAVEPPKESESLAEQLERLSDAFDAVQRYLEQYSLDRMSPVHQEEAADEGPETASLVSGFSSLGLRGKPRFSGSIGTGSLAGTKEPGQSRVQRTTAYRSRILSQQREDSLSRLGKNN